MPLAGLEPAACCLGDNCPYSAEPVPVGSRQLRLDGDSGHCGLVGCSRAWWNDRQNDHLSKQRAGALRATVARRQGSRGKQFGCWTKRGGGELRFGCRPSGIGSRPERQGAQERLRASKDRPTAVRTGVCAGRRGPSGAKLGVLTRASSMTVPSPPHHHPCSTATLGEATSSVSANGGEALCGSPFPQVTASLRWRSHAFTWRTGRRW